MGEERKNRIYSQNSRDTKNKLFSQLRKKMSRIKNTCEEQLWVNRKINRRETVGGRKWRRTRQGGSEWLKNMDHTNTPTHKNRILSDQISSPFQLAFSPIFSVLTISLLINSCFPCYEADGRVRRGMQNNSAVQKASEERDENGRGERQCIQIRGGGRRTERGGRERQGEIKQREDRGGKIN